MPRFTSAKMRTAADMIKSAEANLKEAQKMVRARYDMLTKTNELPFSSDEMNALKTVYTQTTEGLYRVKDAHGALGDWS